jgi:hypothetical protein
MAIGGSLRPGFLELALYYCFAGIALLVYAKVQNNTVYGKFI